MPKKIKKEKDLKFKNNKNKFINVNNVHYYFIGLFIVLICVCVGVGIYRYSQDSYHINSSNAVDRLIYSEKVEGGYDVYYVIRNDEGKIFSTYNTPTSSEENKWGENKFLDYNEEIYASGILNYDTQSRESGADADWSLEIELADGTEKYYSSNATTQVDKTEFAQIIKKYFNKDIIYK